MRPRDLHVRPTFRRRRAWPWVVLAVLVLAVGAVELVRERAVRPAPTVDAAPARAGLEGVVVDAAGVPVADAEVLVALPPVAGPGCPDADVSLVRCDGGDGPSLLLAALAGAGADDARTPATRSDREGRFLLAAEAVRGGSVWARAGTRVSTPVPARPGVPLRLLVSEPRALHGRVVSEDGAPVPSARVRVVRDARSVDADVVAGADGRWTARAPGEGPWALLADAPGLLPGLLRLAAAEREATLVLERPRALEVTLSTPVPGAELRVEGRRLERRTGVEGARARLERLRPGDVRVELRGEDVGAGPVTVRLAADVTQLRLVPVPTGRLTLALVDPRGVPVSGCTLRVAAPDGSVRSALEPRDCGAVVLEPLPEGTYLLEADAPGFVSGRRALTVRRGPASVTWALADAAAVSGTVVDGEGRPAEGVEVVARAGGEAVRSAASGRFVLPVEAAGPVEVLAHDSERGAASLSVVAPARDVTLRLAPLAGLAVRVLSGGRPVVGAQVDVRVPVAPFAFAADRPSGVDGTVTVRGLPAGPVTVQAVDARTGATGSAETTATEGELRPVEVTLQLAPGLSGRVTTEDGVPVPSAIVLLEPPEGAPGHTDAEGRFAIRGLTAGRAYRVRATAPGRDLAEPVEARAGDGEVRLVMRAARPVRGRVVDERGAPLADFRVDGQPVHADDGRFEVPARERPEGVRVRLEAAGRLARTASVRGTSADVGDVALPPAPRLTGRVRDASGAAVVGALVTSAGAEGFALTDATGAFVLGLDAVDEAADAAVPVRAEEGGRAATAEARPGAEVALVLQGPASVRGRAFLPDGRPASDGFVRVSGAAGAVRAWRTGADGAFSGEALPGDARLTVDGQPGRVWFTPLPPPGPLVLGPGPGTSRLVLTLPADTQAVWLVRGAGGAGAAGWAGVAGAPGALPAGAEGQLVFAPGREVVLDGLAAGAWTVQRVGAEGPGAPVSVTVSGEARLSLDR